MAISFLYTDLQQETRSIDVLSPVPWQIDGNSVGIGVGIGFAIVLALAVVGIVVITVAVVRWYRKVNRVQVNPQNGSGKLHCSSNSF